MVGEVQHLVFMRYSNAGPRAGVAVSGAGGIARTMREPA